MPADAAYMRQYREQNPDARDRQMRGQRAFRRALTTLRSRHLSEFTEILNGERAAVGLPPAGVLRPGPPRKDDAA